MEPSIWGVKAGGGIQLPLLRDGEACSTYCDGANEAVAQSFTLLEGSLCADKLDKC